MKRKLILGFVLVALVLSAAAAALTFSSKFAGLQTEATQAPAVPVAASETTEIILPVSGSGTLEPAAKSELGFPQSGVLIELDVQPGDQVQAGDLLARLQIDKTPAEQAAEIALAQLALLSAQNSLEALYEDADLHSAEALSELEATRQELEDLQDTSLEVALAEQTAAQAAENLEDAQMQAYIVQSEALPEAVDIAEAALFFKEKDLAELQTQIARLENQIKRAPNKMVRDRMKTQLLNLQVQLTQQQLAVDKATYKLASMNDAPEDYEVDLAEKRVATAKLQLADTHRALEQAQAGPGQGELQAARVRAAEAETAWQELQDGPDAKAVAQAKAQVTAAQARLAIAQQESLILELTAPLAGSVLGDLPNVGSRINARETVVTLADLSRPTLEVYIDETDLSGVQVGYSAVVTFDALPDETFAGQVVNIAPQLVSSFGGSKAALVWIRLEESPVRDLRTLPLGLNAIVDIQEGT